MADERELPEVSDDEVAAAAAEPLPDREAMSLLRPPGPPGTDLLLGDEVLPTDPVHGL
jgi:hypothetical protein